MLFFANLNVAAQLPEEKLQDVSPSSDSSELLVELQASQSVRNVIIIFLVNKYTYTVMLYIMSLMHLYHLVA